MEDIGKMLVEARKKKNLSIEEVANQTKIRPFVLNAIEKGDLTIMPPVYMKSFIKTYAEFLEISESQTARLIASAFPQNVQSREPDEEQASPKAKHEPRAIKPSITKEKSSNSGSASRAESATATPAGNAIPDEQSSGRQPAAATPSEPKAIDSIITTAPQTDYKRIFKKKGLKQTPKINIVNIAIYSAIFIAVVATLYFTFFSDISFDHSGNRNVDKDTVEVKSKNDNLIGYFEKKDSIRLTAHASDTAWVRIEIDGKKYVETLMKPGMEDNWSAAEYFIVSHGNVGALTFYRNGQKLEQFGARRSMARNIKITKDEVIKNTPWKNDSITLNVSSSTPGRKLFRKPRHKEEPKQEIKIITPSSIDQPSIKKEPGKLPEKIGH